MTNFSDFELHRPHIPASHLFVWLVLGLASWACIFWAVRFVWERL